MARTIRLEDVQRRVDEHFGPERVEVEWCESGDVAFLHEDGLALVLNKEALGSWDDWSAIDDAIDQLDANVGASKIKQQSTGTGRV